MKHCPLSSFVSVALALSLGLATTSDVWAAGGKKTNARRPAPTSSRFNTGQLFNAAMKVYDKENYSQALLGFTKILQRYPAYEPAAIYAAKSLYKMDRLNEAYRYFAVINLNNLDVETSYEYAQTFFSQKNFGQALFAFKRVPSGHALWDLANYYGALCALNTKQYPLAETMLESAVVLPKKLFLKRNLYLKHVEKITLIQQKNDLKKERKKLEQDMATTLKGETKTAGPETTEKIPEEALYEHPGEKKIDKYADLDFKYRYQLGELSGFGENESIHRTFGFHFFNGPKFYLGESKKRKTMLAMQVHVDFEARNTSGKEIRNIAFDDDSDQFRAQETPYPQGQSNNLGIGITPFVEFPLPQDFWGLASVNFEQVFPEIQLDYRGGSHALNLATYKKVEKNLYGVEASGNWVRGEKFRPSSVKIHSGAFTRLDFGSDLFMEGRVNYDVFNYYMVNASGPDSVLKVNAKVYQTFPFGITLTGEANASYKKNHIAFDDVQLPYKANGFELGWLLNAYCQPIPWLKLSITQSRTQTKWDVHSPDDSEASKNSFENLVPNIIMTTEASAAVNLLF